MASDRTFESCWKELLVYYPELPPPLAQRWVNTSYHEALDNLEWSGSRGYGEFRLPAQTLTGLASATLNSASVVGSGTAWTSALVGQQFYQNGTAPFYTIISVESPTALTLDRVWGMASTVSAAYVIQLIYVVCPADFTHFDSVVDIQNRWRIHTFLPQEWLDRVDAARVYAGAPVWVMAAATPSPVTATLDRPRFEVWPRGTGDVTYPFTYSKQLPAMSAATDRPIYPIRGDMVVEGALARLALYKGTKDAPNPYADGNNYKIHRAQFIARVEQMKNIDEGVRQTRIWYEDDRNGWPWAPIDSKFIQTHLFPL